MRAEERRPRGRRKMSKRNRRRKKKAIEEKFFLTALFKTDSGENVIGGRGDIIEKEKKKENSQTR